MPEFIFDSKPKREIYQRLKSVWSKFVDACPHIPVQTMLGYGNVKGQKLTGRFLAVAAVSAGMAFLCVLVYKKPSS